MLNNNIIYLSHFIKENTPVYGGNTEVIQLEKIRTISKGDTSNNLKLTFPGHVNTHIDFPYHFHDNGKKSNDYAPISWIFNKVGFISSSIEDIENKIAYLPKDIECLILKTGFEQYRGLEKYWKEQPIINAALATTLKSNDLLLPPAFAGSAFAACVDFLIAFNDTGNISKFAIQTRM